MPSETERRLEQLFSQLPEPEPEAGERALARALRALPARQRRPRRNLPRLAILLAAAVALLALAAGALAAAGALHVSIGRPSHQRTTAAAGSTRSPQLRLPAGAHGIAAVVDGRLWLTTRSGLRLQRLPVTAAALSPHALYVAAGLGNSLVAMAPDGRRAWSHPTGGPIAAIAWAPDGLRIAYIVHSGHGFRLHVIVGNGADDRQIDQAVRPVRPSWRADSLAVAYVAAGGKPVVYDLGHRSRQAIASSKAQDATRLAFAPSGRTLAIGTLHGFLVTGGGTPANGFDFSPATVGGLGWLNGRLALAVNPTYPATEKPFVQLFEVSHGAAKPQGSLVPAGPVQAFDAFGSDLTLALAVSRTLRVLTSSPGTPTKTAHLPVSPIVLGLPAGSHISTIDVR